jgi:hypothetical protein
MRIQLKTSTVARRRSRYRPGEQARVGKFDNVAVTIPGDHQQAAVFRAMRDSLRQKSYWILLRLCGLRIFRRAIFLAVDLSKVQRAK